MSCLGDEGRCDKPVFEDELCRGHYARRRRGCSIDSPLRHWGDPKRTLFEAALALAEVGDDDEAYLRVIRYFWKAVDRHQRQRRDKVHSRQQSRRHDR